MISESTGYRLDYQASLEFHVKSITFGIGIGSFQPSKRKWFYHGYLISKNYQWLKIWRIGWLAVQIGKR